MEVLCKFKCVSVSFEENTATIKMEAVTHDSEENARFFKYTPSGTFVAQIVKHEVARQFVPGQEYNISIWNIENVRGNN